MSAPSAVRRMVRFFHFLQNSTAQIFHQNDSSPSPFLRSFGNQVSALRIPRLKNGKTGKGFELTNARREKITIISAEISRDAVFSTVPQPPVSTRGRATQWWEKRCACPRRSAVFSAGACFGTLWVNLYIPSQLDWRETGMVLRQEGDITRGEPVRFTVVKGGTQAATVNFRIPSWISQPTEITLNGKAQESATKASSYSTITRAWKPGDVVVLTLPAALRLVRAKDDPSMVSVFFGPVLLAGELGRDNIGKDFGDKDAFLKVPAVPVPDVANASEDPARWLSAVKGAASTFTAHDAGPANGIIFRPLFEVHHERYSVYWHLQK